MAIRILIYARRGAGKAHLVQKIEELLLNEGYGATIHYDNDAVVKSFNGSPRVVIREGEDPLQMISDSLLDGE